MTLLEFARGPGFEWAFIILLVGIAWRVFGAFLLRARIDRSEPRNTATMRGGLRTVLTRSLPPPEFEKKIRFQHLTGYGWHIGFFVTLFFYGPHIAFFEDLLGFGWPALPNLIVWTSATVTIAILVALLVRRMIHPVLKLISNADDYISWIVTTLPLVTGLLAFGHITLFRYETLLAIHLLTVELLMVWLPFGKLMHMVLLIPSRYQLGKTYSRRGVKA